MTDASLDTNVLLRWLLGDVPKQQALADVLLAKKQTYHVADMAIQESVYVMEKVIGMPRELVVQAMRLVIAQANINCNRTLLLKTLPLYLKHPGVSFTDICLAVYAALDGHTPLYTYDKKLARQIPHVDEVK